MKTFNAGLTYFYCITAKGKIVYDFFKGNSSLDWVPDGLTIDREGRYLYSAAYNRPKLISLILGETVACVIKLTNKISFFLI